MQQEELSREAFEEYVAKVKTIKQCPHCGYRYQEELSKESRCMEHPPLGGRDDWPMTAMEQWAAISNGRA